LFFQDIDDKFESNPFEPANVSAGPFPARCHLPSIPLFAIDSANAPGAGGIDKQVEIKEFTMRLEVLEGAAVGEGVLPPEEVGDEGFGGETMGVGIVLKGADEVGEGG
jgi:hypothetical protein